MKNAKTPMTANQCTVHFLLLIVISFLVSVVVSVLVAYVVDEWYIASIGVVERSELSEDYGGAMLVAFTAIATFLVAFPMSCYLLVGRVESFVTRIIKS